VARVSEETKQTLRDVSTEIGAGKVLFPMSDLERTWNDAHERTLQIIQNYSDGFGLFQMTRQPTATDEAQRSPASATPHENEQGREPQQGNTP
jgi:hypothetical protein